MLQMLVRLAKQSVGIQQKYCSPQRKALSEYPICDLRFAFTLSSICEIFFYGGRFKLNLFRQFQLYLILYCTTQAIIRMQNKCGSVLDCVKAVLHCTLGWSDMAFSRILETASEEKVGQNYCIFFYFYIFRSCNYSEIFFRHFQS